VCRLDMRLLSAVALLLPATVFADAPKSAEQMQTDDCARARKLNRTCVLDMRDETIEGDVGRGEGERISLATFGKQTSLIRIRRDFIPEIIKTAEDI
jgi:hypothetical protein